MKYAILSLLLLGCGQAGQIAVCTIPAIAKCMCLHSGLPPEVCARPEVLAEFETQADMASEVAAAEVGE